MANTSPGTPWEERVERYLISKGIEGVKQAQLVIYFKDIASAETILPYLELLREQRKVDRYTVPTRGRPATVWRATTKILEPDTDV